MTGDVRGRWLVAAALALVVSGCGEASSDLSATAPPAPVSSPTVVPAAEGRVTTTGTTLVTDDGSGPWLCWSGNVEFAGGDGPSCDDARVTGWDWDAVGVHESGARGRWGRFVLTGTFDGQTFAVDEVTQPDDAKFTWDFEIPCPTPEGGWQVADPTSTTQDTMLGIGRLEEQVPGFAMVAVSTSAGEPGPRDPMDTVVSLFVAGDPRAAEEIVRRTWGGMLCVVEVEHSLAELEKVQRALLDVPGVTEVGSGDADNVVELSVFHDDGSIQRWADQEFGEGLVVVSSNLQPVG